jgi:hypothetical protein
MKMRPLVAAVAAAVPAPGSVAGDALRRRRRPAAPSRLPRGVLVLALGLMISVASALPPAGAGRAHSAWAEVSALSPEAAGAQGGNVPTPRSLFLGPRAELARIITPRQDELVTGRALRVVIGLRPGTTRFRAWLDRAEVTRRFRARSGGRRSARLPRRLLRRGLNDLVVRSGDRRGRRDFDSVRVASARRAPGLLGVRVRGARRRGVLRTSGTLRVRARLPARIDRVRLRLNGRPAGASLVGGSLRRGRLAADDGLRFGRNVLTITAWHERGAFDRERRVVFVSRARPLAAAGRHRRVSAGARVRLDARASRPRRRGERLAFAWRVVRRPKGASPRLLRRRSARPAFIPDRPGRYRLQVRVRGLATGALSATDVLDACVQPNLPPVGAALDTHARAGNDPAIQVGDKSYPYPSTGVGLVVLDRCSLTPLKATWFAPGALGQAAYKTQLDNVVNAAKTQGRSYLVFLAAEPGVAAPMPPYAASGFAALTTVGPTSTPDPAKPDIVNAGGTVARDPNAAPDTAGALAGYLQLDNHGLFTLARPVTAAFDTRQVIVDGQPQARIEVGSRSWTSGPVPQGGQAGFMMLALDRSSLRPVQGTPYVTQVNGGQFPDEATQSIVARQLQSLSNSGALVLVQSIGNPKPTTSAWGDIASVMDQLGGSRHVVNTLDGSGGYALVGCSGCSWPVAQEASFPLTKPHGASDGRLAGRLALNDSSQWAPWLSDLSGGFDYTYAEIMGQPPSSWPCGLAANGDVIQPPCSAGHQAALDWITEKILPAKDWPVSNKWCQQVRTFRNAYCNDRPPWGQIGPEIDPITNPNLCPDAPGLGFTKEQCQDVQRELSNELKWRETVYSRFRALERPIDKTQGAISYIDLQDIYHTITQAGNMRQPQGQATPSLGEILMQGLEALALANPEAELLETVASAASMITRASEITRDENGAPIFDDVGVEADQLANEMVNRYLDVTIQMDRLKLQVLSDYAKLKAVAGPPDFNDESVDETAPKLRLGAVQWIWQRLLPKAYWMFKFRAPPSGRRLNDLQCVREAKYFYPFQPLSDNASWTPITGFDQNMTPQRQFWYAPGNGPLLETIDNLPYPVKAGTFAPAPGVIFDKLWRQPPDNRDPTLPGLYEPWFHKRANDGIAWERFVDYSAGHFPGYELRQPFRPCWYGDQNHPIEP